ncbi:MAG: polysaccharide deacetylase family protein, partial [Candidatus Rokuibacteriota bacterium]
MRYVWPDGKRSAVVLSFDFDAESGFLSREPEKSKRSLGTLEERRFGPRVGVDRILRLLDRLELPASFFIPGWTVENHLAEAKRIRDAGHEIGAHGNVHEAVDGMTREQEEAIMRAQLRILQDHLGVRPAGYRSPSWDVNLWTPDILKTHGLRYDSSLMGNDVPYEVDTSQGPLVEVPVQWLLDDAPLFRHVYGASNAIADPERVLQMWSREFAGMHAENACFVLTCHPFIIGRASRIAMLEELIRYMRRAPGVWFTTCEAIAR